MQELLYLIYILAIVPFYLFSDIHRFIMNETGGKLSVYIFHHHVEIEIERE